VKGMTTQFFATSSNVSASNPSHGFRAAKIEIGDNGVITRFAVDIFPNKALIESAVARGELDESVFNQLVTDMLLEHNVT
jgi:uncharacterized protein YbcC (UPF0753/DUF2309 family)